MELEKQGVWGKPGSGPLTGTGPQEPFWVIFCKEDLRLLGLACNGHLWKGRSPDTPDTPPSWMAVGDGEEIDEINLFMVGGQPEGQVGPERLPPFRPKQPCFYPFIHWGLLVKMLVKRATLL